MEFSVKIGQIIGCRPLPNRLGNSGSATGRFVHVVKKLMKVAVKSHCFAASDDFLCFWMEAERWSPRRGSTVLFAANISATF